MDAAAPSLNERLFWPVVVFATLALGGFAYFAATKMFRPRPVDALGVSETPAPSTSLSTPPPTESAVVAALEAAPAESVAAAEPAEAAPAAPLAAMEPDDPYVVPDHKPFLTKPVAPAPKAAPKRPVAPPKIAPAAPKTTPVASKTAPLTKPPTAEKIPLSSDIKMPVIPAARHPVYVLNDGRRIPAAKVVDMGEFWGLKTTAGQILSVRKDVVKNVER